MDKNRAKEILKEIRDECDNSFDCSKCAFYTGKENIMSCFLDCNGTPNEWEIDEEN